MKKLFIDKDGKKVEATTEVEIKEVNGKFEVEFPEFNSTGFEGDLVCFEEIYDKDGKKIDEHKVFENKDQTIRVYPLASVNFNYNEVPGQNENTGVNTGDYTSLLSLTIMFILSLAGIYVLKGEK
ncbi:MAG: hypothetical protein PUI85_05180 [Eubacteriales bacterium]|nr:hypothetical protein [Eubacteriales bacterium]